MTYRLAPYVVVLTVLLTCMLPAVASDVVTLHIYRDGSVAFEGAYLSASTVAGSTTLNISCGKNITTFYIRIEENSTKNMETSTESAFSIVQDKIGEIVTDKIAVNMSVEEEGGHLKVWTVKPITMVLSIRKLVAEIRGAVSLQGKGKGAQAVLLARTLNKNVAEALLSALNLTGVTIDMLNVSAEGNTVKIAFKLHVNLTQLSGKHLNQQGLMLLRSIVRKLSYPLKIDVRLSKKGGHYVLTYEGTIQRNVNDIIKDLKDVKTLLEAFKVPRTTTVLPIHPTAPLVASDTIDALKDFANTFKVLPSNASIVAVSSSGVVTVYFRTPKIIKKGATSPADTLNAIYGFVKKHETFSQILNTSIVLAPEKGVKVTINGTPATTIKFSEIPDLKITLENLPPENVQIPPRTELTAVLATLAVIVIGTLIAVAVKKRK